MIKELLITPYSSDEKHLKFLKKPNGDLSNMAKLIGPIDPITCGYTGDNKMYITPHNGPTLIEGHKVPNNDEYTIQKIHYSTDVEYYILELIKS